MSTIPNLDLLLKPFIFTTDPKDGIKNVKVTRLGLRTFNGKCNIILKIPSDQNLTIYQLISRWINDNNPIENLTVQEVVISFKFHNIKSLPVTIRECGYCSLKPTPLETIIAKYLNKWGIYNLVF